VALQGVIAENDVTLLTQLHATLFPYQWDLLI
jgi:hypothetical protein